MSTRPRPRATILRSRTVYRGPVFDVRHDEVIEPGQIRATRDVVAHPGSAVVLPVLHDGRLLLVRQYRYAVGRFLWELIAGRIDADESPLTAARRELREETGYTARRFRRLFDAYPTPGFVSERFVLYLATGLRAGRAHPEPDEKLDMRPFRLRELLTTIRRGELRDAKSIAGILYYAAFIARRA